MAEEQVLDQVEAVDNWSAGVVEPVETNIEEEPISPTDTEPEPGSGDEPGDGDAPTDTEPQAAAAKPTYKPQEVAKMLREMRETKPEMANLARHVQDSYFRMQEYEKTFPTLESAQQVKTMVDLLGGMEGLEELRDLNIGVQDIDNMVAEGNPQVLDDMAEASPEGFTKLVPAAVERLQKMNPEAFTAMIRPHLVRGLENSGLSDTVASTSDLMRRAYKAADPEHAKFYLEQAFTRMQQVDEWLAGLKQEAQNQPQPVAARQSPAPRVQAMPQFDVEVNREVANWATQQISQKIAAEFKDKNLTDEQRQDLLAGIAQEIDKRLEGDDVFVRNRNAWMRAGKKEALAKFLKTNIGTQLPQAVKSVWQRRYGATAYPVKQATKKIVQSQPVVTKTQPDLKSAIPVPQKPPRDRIDWRRDPEQLLYMTGRAWLKDGRFVRWPKS